MCTEGPRRHHGRARKSCVFLCDLHPLHVEYILKSVSKAACGFYVWNGQDLKIYIASTFHVGLGCCTYGSCSPMWGEQFKIRACMLLSGSLGLLFKLSSVCIVFVCKKLFPWVKPYMCVSISFVLGGFYFLGASLPSLSVSQFHSVPFSQVDSCVSAVVPAGGLGLLLEQHGQNRYSGWVQMPPFSHNYTLNRQDPIGG